jgi:hypothetical protein
VRNADYKSREGLAKPDLCEDFGAANAVSLARNAG